MASQSGSERGQAESISSEREREMDDASSVSSVSTAPSVSVSSQFSRTSSGSTVVPAMMFAETRKRGTKGKPLHVITNYLAMEKRPNFTIKQYRVDFIPPEDSTFLKKVLLNSHRDKLGAFLFDGAMLYRANYLPETCLKFHATGNSGTYEITLRKVGEVNSESPTFLQFYNTVMRKCLNLMDLEELGRNHYNRLARIMIPEACLELWPGYITAIRKHDGGVLLCAEVTHKVLRTTTVLDLVRDLLAKNRDLKRGQDAIRKEVVGQIVITHYNKKTYRIDDIDFDSTPRSVFNTKGPDGEPKEISYETYYRQRYGITIEENDLSQPLLVSHPRRRDINKGMRTNIYLVPSICNLTGLSEDQRKNFRLMQKLAEHLHMDPIKRKAKLDEFMSKMKNNEAVQKELSNWDVDFNPEFLKAHARVLTPELVHLTNKIGTDTSLCPIELNADWTAYLKKYFMLSRVALMEWVMILPEEQRRNAPRLVTALKEQAQQLGMDVHDPITTLCFDGRERMNEEKFVKAMADFQGSFKFAVVVLPNNQLQRYTAMKKLFVLRYGIPIQCFLAKNFESKNYNSIINKMAIQINAKLGGVPWSVRIPYNSKVMILGYDVYHCAERRNESVGALVATTSTNFGRYHSVVSFHKDKSELSRNMCHDTIECLRAFKRENGCLPDRIVLYRDGVGEGQIDFVMQHEVSMMLSAIRNEYDGGVEPKFTFIIVTKKINTRFMAIRGGQVINPPPGTVLDEVITLPNRFDFFLVSQTVRQGTVSPTNYNVIYDNSSATADSLQLLTFKMCHLYYNWSGTVAVPAPCQYAHKLAYLTGVALGDKAPNQLSSTLWYL